MAKTKEVTDTVETVETVEVVADSSQKARWEAFLAKYEKENPEKFASRKAAGQLEMPKNF